MLIILGQIKFKSIQVHNGFIILLHRLLLLILSYFLQHQILIITRIEAVAFENGSKVLLHHHLLHILFLGHLLRCILLCHGLVNIIGKDSAVGKR